MFEGTPEVIRSEVDRVMGMDLFLGESRLSEATSIGILVAVGVLFIIFSTMYLTLSKKRDR